MLGSLTQLAPGVYAWLSNQVDLDATNVGLVIAEDGITVVDSGLVPSHARQIGEAIGELTSLPTRRLVFTGSHIDLVGGSSAFPLPAIYGTLQTSAHLDQPANPDVWARLHPHHAAELGEVETRRVTHVVTEAAHLCPASIAVPCAGLQFENLAVQVPAANVVFAGGLASFGTVPLGFEADIDAWITTLELLGTWGELIVPAHGPIGGADELRDLRNYFEACADASGDPTSLRSGPWDQWSNQEFTPVNVERAAMLQAGDPSPPPSALRLLGLA